MTAENRSPRPANVEAAEARFAKRVAAGLSAHHATLPHDIEQRLRVAREQALQRARHARAAVAAPVVLAQRGGALAFGGSPWWLRLASMAPIAVLFVGLVLIDRLNSEQQILAAAEIDAVLLADDLPPAAYTDPGFGEFVKQPLP